jgi:chemotaxis signal transduction protein
VTAPLQQLVTFNLDEQHFALFLGTVERIVAMAEITPLPGVRSESFCADIRPRA